MFTKPQIYTFALGALLLQRQVIDPTTDKSNEAKVLNSNWDMAWLLTLQDLDLDSTSETMVLTIAETNPNDNWNFAYTYPNRCAFLRRLIPTNGCHAIKDSRATQITKKTGMLDGDKVIFTNEVNASAEFIPKDIDVTDIPAPAAMAIAYRLAMLSAPLIVGKGAAKLREELETRYAMAKAEAQELDHNENNNFEPEYIDSEFVADRLS